MGDIKDWKVGYTYRRQNGSVKSAADVKSVCSVIIPAEVPGAFELSLFRAGLEPDPFFGNNFWGYRKYESAYIYMYTELELSEEAKDSDIVFDGIDTVADIFINGEFVYHADNMFIPHSVPADTLHKGKNEIVLAFTPLLEEAAKHRLPAMCNTLFYNYEALYIRRPMHTFGWDIAPRFLGQGLFKRVHIEKRRHDSIAELFVYTLCVDAEKNYARVRVYFALDISSFPREYTFKIKGQCGDSVFSGECCPSSREYTRLAFTLNDAKLWWPKNQGEQNIYDITAELLHGNETVDIRHEKIGIRKIEIHSTEVTDGEGNGDFSFTVNGRRIFIMGTNWVPLSPFHSEDSKRLPGALSLLDGTGCNAVRMWGGNLYESDEFFDFCDAHGILVWQDFALACAVYPRDGAFLSKLRPEFEYTVKRLRNHPSLAVWAGDNECDLTLRDWSGVYRDPNDNIITRVFIPSVLHEHDFTRPYIPSSPYISKKCFDTGLPPVEDHLWGPRNYFKGDFYKNAKCCFASEIGYHACPSPASLSKFISKDMMFPCFTETGEPNAHWLAHSTESQPDGELSYKYRIRLLYNQVKTLLGKVPDNIEDYSLASQISQAEAMKYFIESFRIKRWRRTGIIWWNLIDCWPQISDAVVDSYFEKKLAYFYIVRSQSPFCLMFDEPEGNEFRLWAVNDKCAAAKASFTVFDATEKKPVYSGTVESDGNSKALACSLFLDAETHRLLYIEWTVDGQKYSNHYYINTKNISLEDYKKDYSSVFGKIQ